MIKTGILNPHIAALLCKIRHTNMLVLADRGLSFFPGLETVDISLTDDVPTVLQVFGQIRPNFVIGEVVMATEFFSNNAAPVKERYMKALEGLTIVREPQVDFNRRASGAIGLIRTGDTTQWGNMILVSR